MKRLSAARHAGLSAYWFANQLHWIVLLQIVIPRQIAAMTGARQALWTAFVIGVGAVVPTVAPPIIGALSDRCMSRWGRRRPYMLCGTLINALGLALMWAAASGLIPGGIIAYLVAFLFVQFGSNVSSSAYMGVIPDMVPAEQRGVASGWMAAMSQVGMILGALGGGMLMERNQVGAIYLLVAAFLLLFLAWTALATPEEPRMAADPPLSVRDIVDCYRLDWRKHPDFAWVWITRFLFTTGMWVVQPYLFHYVRDVVGARHPSETVGYLMAAAMAAAILTGIIGGAVSDRIGRKPVVYVANGLMAAVGIAFLFSRSATTTLLLGAAYGLGLGAYTSVDWALGCDVLPDKENAARHMGVWHISMALPQSIAPFIGGLALHLGGMSGAGDLAHYHVAGFWAIFLMAALFLLLSGLLLRNVRGVR